VVRIARSFACGVRVLPSFIPHNYTEIFSFLTTVFSAFIFAPERRASMADSIGARIRVARLQYGMSQAELARRVGISKTSMNAIELGRQRVSGEQVAAVAIILKVSGEYLLGLRERTDDHPRHGLGGEYCWQAWPLLQELLCSACGEHRAVV
jgi:transcriptional regulator with XRE-family HTH domain